jgi:outer membrane lipoprotein-sorting protein
MNRLTAVCTGLMVGGFVLSGIAYGHAQTAEDILNKSDAVYSNAKTYQATYHWEDKWFDEHGHNHYSRSEMSEVKAIGMSKFALHMVKDSPKGQRHKIEDTSDIYDDGTDHYLYPAGKDYYYMDTHDDFIFMITRNNSDMLDRILPHLKPRPGFTYTLLVPTKVNGKAAYVIEAKGSVQEMSMKPDGTVKVKGQTIHQFFMPEMVTEYMDDLIYIDQENFHLLQRKGKHTWPDLTSKTIQTIKREVLNAPIPDCTFVFVIPKGVTELGK